MSATHAAEDAASSGAEDAGAGGGCEESFAAGTFVATPTGERPIASLHAGQAVVAYNPTTHASQPQAIQAVSIHHDANLVDVTLRVTGTAHDATRPASTAGTESPATPTRTTSTYDETVHTTSNHPWLTADRSWEPAGFLRIGEPVVEANGNTAIVVAVRSVPGAADMWDLTVATVHTFAVGSGQFVVHNDACQDVRDRAKNEIDNSLADKHIQKSMNKRGWTRDEILDTIDNGEPRQTADITNGVNSPDPATRFTSPATGRAVIVNNATGRIIQLGDRGFLYDFYDNIADRFWPRS